MLIVGHTISIVMVNELITTIFKRGFVDRIIKTNTDQLNFMKSLDKQMKLKLIEDAPAVSISFKRFCFCVHLFHDPA